ncbi:MAG: acyltransferase [Planctomycetota bacterium]|nr:acyltransferase [Planctomycetota bacterium]
MTQSPDAPSPGTDRRDPSLDVLRGGAMLFGVVLHSIIPYLINPLPHLLWPVRAPAAWTFDALYWWIHGFRVQMFFLIAGIFAIRSVRSLGTRAFVEHRIRRLGLPLLAAQILVVGALMYPIWALGWICDGLALPKHLWHFRFRHGMQQDLFGYAHLWFIAYLLLYSLLLALLMGRGRDGGVRRGGADVDRRGSAWWFVGLFGATAAWLYVDPRCLLEFHNWFLPRGSELVYHGMFFGAGVWLGDHPATILVIRRWWWLALGCSQAIFPWYFEAIVRWEGAGHVVPAMLAAAYGWTSVLGWLGFAGACVTRTWPVMEYLSRRAYWLYLIHPPLVGLMQIYLNLCELPAWAKATLVFLCASSVGLLMRGPCLEAAGAVERWWRRWRSRSASSRS